MNAKEERLYEQTLKSIDFYDKEFTLEKLSHREKRFKVENYLQNIVDTVGYTDYLFIIAVTKLEEKHGKFLESLLWEILDDYSLRPEIFRRDVAFAAFFNLALHYYRYFKITELKKLLTTDCYYKSFYNDFPLVYESVGRFFVRTSQFDRMLLIAKVTLKKLQEFAQKDVEDRTCKSGYVQTGENVALKVTYLVAMNSIFEHCFLRNNFFTDEVKEKAKQLNDIEISEIPPEEIDDFLARKESFEYNLSNFDISDVELAEEYADATIEYNPNYPKYYYLKAQIIFYGTLFKKKTLTSSKWKQINDLLDTAKSKENKKAADYVTLCAQYEKFAELVAEYVGRGVNNSERFGRNLVFQQKQRELLNMEECPPPQLRPQLTATDDNEPYVFISYSTKNFKNVYYDIIEMQKRGIKYWYDCGTIPGERWDEIVGQKIKNATCVICYLSPESMISSAIIKELKMIYEWQKPIICVDLTQKKQITKAIVEVIRESDLSIANAISADAIKTLMQVFDDDVDVITRSSDPTVVSHVDRIEKVLMQKFRNVFSTIESQAQTWKNSIKNKPNEDYFINDDTNRVYCVVDGISRTAEEYEMYSGSLAYEVSKTFSEEFHTLAVQGIADCRNVDMVKTLISDCFNAANEKVRIMLKGEKEKYQGKEIPGCVGIVALIFNKKLCFGSFGDCMGILVRNGQQIVFAEKQTTYAFDCLKLEKNRELLYSRFVNNPNEDYSYGVVNGDKRAVDCLKISHIDLIDGDVVYLVSDGISDYPLYCKAKKVDVMSLEEIYENSLNQDVEMKKPYHDDKAIVRIFIGNNKVL